MKSYTETWKVERVMLVDDSRIDNFVNKKILEQENFASEVLVFNKPLEALEYLRSIDLPGAGIATIPAFIFLDMNMPQMDGTGFIDEFEKLSPDFKNHCKIIVLSCFLPYKDNDFMEKECVTGSISKPLMRYNLEEIKTGAVRKGSKRAVA